MFKTILVGIDFSEVSKRTFDFARELASQTGAKIVLLTVLEVNDLRVAMSHDLSGFNDSEQLRQMVRDWVDHEFDALAPSDAGVERVVARGIVDQVIREEAVSRKADMIVLGLRGIGNHLALGSTAHAVIRKSVVPVTVVP